MKIKRTMLFSVYKTLRAIGYIKCINKSSNNVNILNFHRVNNNDSESLTTPVKLFEEMMETIVEYYKPISLPALIDKIRNRDVLDARTVAITFDDGYKDNYLEAAPILKKYGLHATFFITSGYINTTRIFPWDMKTTAKHPLMTWDEVRKLVEMGFTIGAHTVNHINLGEVDTATARHEIENAKLQIEHEINKKINLFSFPFGGKDCISAEVIQLVKEAGFDCCCSAYGGKVTASSDPYNLNRVSMYPSITEMMMELDGFMTYFDGRMKINIFGVKDYPRQ